MGMDRSEVQAWLDRYIEAWRSGKADDIADLFGEDVVYRYNPYAPESRWLRGRDAVVNAWLDENDEPGSWEAAYTAYAVDEDRPAVRWRSPVHRVHRLLRARAPTGAHLSA